MTLQLLPSEFPYKWGKFYFLFLSVQVLGWKRLSFWCSVSGLSKKDYLLLQYVRTVQKRLSFPAGCPDCLKKTIFCWSVSGLSKNDYLLVQCVRTVQKLLSFVAVCPDCPKKTIFWCSVSGLSKNDYLFLQCVRTVPLHGRHGPGDDGERDDRGVWLRGRGIREGVRPGPGLHRQAPRQAKGVSHIQYEKGGGGHTGVGVLLFIVEPIFSAYATRQNWVVMAKLR